MEDKKYYQHNDELQPGEFVKRHHTIAELESKADVLGLLDGSLNKPASRRNFLKLAGFSTVLATVLNSCEKPIHKAIPYLIKPEEITPGSNIFYSSTFFDGEEYCAILAKSRDGRPIKIEGNPKSSLTLGGTSARVQASILGLYDNDRFHDPLKGGNKIAWDQADAEITAKLNDISSKNGRIVLLTSSIISPAANNIIREFILAYPSVMHVTCDAVSCSSILEANEKNFGQRILPSYRFDRADLIVSFGADFLGTWISPVEFTEQYAAKRKLKNNKDSMSRHVQFETGMSITGSNADERFPIRPSEEYQLLYAIFQAVTSGTAPKDERIAGISDELKKNHGKSLVISGSGDTRVQLVVNAINEALGNYGITIDLGAPVYTRQGRDADMISLTDELEKGSVDALFVYNINPVYHFPDAARFVSGLKKVPLTVSLSTSPDETSVLCNYVCPSGHYLENWGDAEPVKDHFSLQQPLINPIFNTRQWEESLLKWMGNATGYHQYLMNYWEKNMLSRQDDKKRFYDFWTATLQEGIFEPSSGNGAAPAYKSIEIPAPAQQPEGVELHLYEPVGIVSGRHANNPWLQELPDPVTKAVWENYAAISPKMASDHGLKDFDVITIAKNISLPVLIQPGQAYNTISVALGYGRTHTGKVADGVGINVYPLATPVNGNIRFSGQQVTIQKTGQKHTVSRSQVYSEMDGRPIVRESILAEYRNNPEAGNEIHKEFEKKNVSLYPKPNFDGFHWGMSVDLNSCTGCGACIIACQAENNIPVVGKEEVGKSRIMHWIRIDRYYAGKSEQPEVVHQPVMCMHCANAPCENVCPVSATPHNNEGLNQVAYTRCVGTKYCINNCPYKVRKFNWFRYAENPKFNYHENTDLGRLVLNPDVTVRERGVVEKCSFCVQRIQEKKLTAKLENRVLNGEEVQPACVQACPAKALVFGDLNNKSNAVVINSTNDRNYYLLEELHTLPSVGYLTKIRNRQA